MTMTTTMTMTMAMATKKVKKRKKRGNMSTNEYIGDLTKNMRRRWREFIIQSISQT